MERRRTLAFAGALAAGVLSVSAAIPASAAPLGANFGATASFDGATVRFQNNFSHMCLDDYSFSTADGNAIVQYTCNGLSNQNWYIQDAGESDGSVTIRNSFSGKCLDNAYGSASDANKIQQWGCGAGNPNQEWYIGWHGSDNTGWYLINRAAWLNSGAVYVVDDYAYSQYAGHAVLLYHFDDQWNQQWSLS